MSVLRRRMIETLRIRNYSPRTITRYVEQIADFARHFGRSPHLLGLEEIHQYQLYLLEERKAKRGTLVVAVSALRILYRDVLRKDWMITYIPFPRKEQPLPVVLSREEVERLLAAAANARERTILLTLYATGLRLSELISLRIDDIDKDRRMILVRRGKGNKDRYIPLVPTLHQALQDYYRQFRPQEWLFPGEVPGHHIVPSTPQGICRRARLRAGIRKPVTPHTLRRCFATHLVEGGVELTAVRRLLGHHSLHTVERYLLVSRHSLDPDRGALDLLRGLGSGSSRQE